MDELRMIAGCKNRDREAQRALYNEYSRKMYAICLRYMSDEDSAKDLLQDGFIKIFSSIESFQGKGSFEGWIKRIFVNLALETIRKQKNIFSRPDDMQVLPDVVDDTTDDEMYKISETELLRMIKELPKGYSTIFNLYAVEDLSHKEIADMLGINEGTSRSQYVRARKILQEKVKQYIKENY